MALLAPLVRQIGIMFLYIAAGYALYRTGKLSKQDGGVLSTLLIWFVVPALILNSFCVEPTPERVRGLAVSTAAAAAALALSLLAARLLFAHRPLEQFGAAFSNAGFIGLPLVQAALGSEAVFYIVSFTAMLNVLQWTYGVAVITEKPLKLRRAVLLHPIMLATAAGMLLFFTGWGARLPGVLLGAASGISALNAPLAMLMLGVNFAQARLRALAFDPLLYAVTAVRGLLIPMLTLGLLALLPLPGEARAALLIVASAPVGANVAVYAQLYGRDYAHASQLVVHSTLLCVLTLPLVMAAAGALGQL